MGRNANNKKIGVSDLAAAWRAGWSPSDVNAILDRLDAIGDPNDPLPAVDDVAAEDVIVDDVDNVEVDEVDEDDEDDTDEASNNNEDDKLSDEVNKNLDKLKTTAMEVENERLKNEIKRLQAINRRKDLSGGDKIKKSLENSLIDTFQSLFD